MMFQALHTTASKAHTIPALVSLTGYGFAKQQRSRPTELFTVCETKNCHDTLKAALHIASSVGPFTIKLYASVVG